MDKKCKYCNRVVRGTSHYCTQTRVSYNSDLDDFLVSATIGYVTNSAIIGSALGGDIAGGIVGDIMNGNDLMD